MYILAEVGGIVWDKNHILNYIIKYQCVCTCTCMYNFIETVYM